VVFERCICSFIPAKEMENLLHTVITINIGLPLHSFQLDDYLPKRGEHQPFSFFSQLSIAKIKFKLSMVRGEQVPSSSQTPHVMEAVSGNITAEHATASFLLSLTLGCG
jgi:hypothetical protein